MTCRSILLVLDHCEHVLDGVAPLVDALLRGCPGVRILATSRQSLGVAGEAACSYRCLIRRRCRSSDLRATRQRRCSSSARSPRHRAFTLTEKNARAVAQIFVRLDGLPLALELAAARVRVLSPEQIATRLHDHFRLLSGGLRTAPARQPTLQAALHWSFGLLSEQERKLFGRLAVFAGGWTPEAAEMVCTDEIMPRESVLDLIDQLVDKSLVTADVDATQVRYRYLQPARAYALEVLHESGEEQMLRARHVHAVTVIGLGDRVNARSGCSLRPDSGSRKCTSCIHRATTSSATSGA